VCIAIYKPETIELYKSTVKNCFLHHSDGAGFVVHNPENNTLTIEKGFFTFDALWKAMKPYKGHRMLLHFRWATHGESNAANCHPFMIGNNLAFMHNGVIKDVRQWDKTMSDTWHFGEAIVRPLVKDYPDIIHNPIVGTLIKDFISTGSKLVFMDNFGKVTIINETAGTWDTKCWFSNTTYQKPPEKARTHEKKTTVVTTYPPYKPYDPSVPLSANLYRSGERTKYEILLETLFIECEAEEIKRDSRVEKLEAITLELPLPELPPVKTPDVTPLDFDDRGDNDDKAFDDRKIVGAEFDFTMVE
jgi:hypothetical protein